MPYLFFPFYQILRWHVFFKRAELVEVYADAFTAVPYRKRFTPVLCGRITMESSGLKSSISPCSWSASNDCSGAFDQHSGFSSLPLPSPSPTSALVTQLDESLHYGFRYLNSAFPEEGNYAQPWQYWFWTIKLFREKKIKVLPLQFQYSVNPRTLVPFSWINTVPYRDSRDPWTFWVKGSVLGRSIGQALTGLRDPSLVGCLGQEA